MNSIHAPTVPAVASGPTSGHIASNGTLDNKASLFQLMDEKDQVEAELKALGEVLSSHGVNMSTSLTTFDGYPRDDLDVAQIRTIRSRIIPLRNDYKALMLRIESGLHAHHALMAANAESSSQAGGDVTTTDPSSSSTRFPTAEAADPPFAKVMSVNAGSPAEEAGLRAGDRVRSFGTVTWLTHEKLSRIAETVQSSEGISVTVKIVRTNGSEPTQREEEKILRVVPRSGWGGRGKLGCHLVPI